MVPCMVNTTQSQLLLLLYIYRVKSSRNLKMQKEKKKEKKSSLIRVLKIACHPQFICCSSRKIMVILTSAVIVHDLREFLSLYNFYFSRSAWLCFIRKKKLAAIWKQNWASVVPVLSLQTYNRIPFRNFESQILL